MAVLLITHDIGVVTEVADRVIVMRHGAVVEAGDADQVFTRPERAYTPDLLASAPHPDPARVLDSAAPDQPLMAVAGLRRTFRPGPAFRPRRITALAGAA